MSDGTPSIYILKVSKEEVLAKIEKMKAENNKDPKDTVRLMIENGQKLIKANLATKCPIRYYDNSPEDPEKMPGLTYEQACTIIDDPSEKYGIMLPVGEDRFCFDVDNNTHTNKGIAKTPEGYQADCRGVDFLFECFDELVQSGAHIDQSPNGWHVWFSDDPNRRGKGNMLPNGSRITKRTSKNVIIVYPSKGRFNITPVERLWSSLPVVPDHWVPVCSETEYKKRKDKAPSPRSLVSQHKKEQKIEFALQHACETILNAQPGNRNSVHNQSIFTVAGIVAGAIGAGLTVDPDAYQEDLVRACQENMLDDPAKAERDARSAWAAGYQKPLACDIETINGELKKLAQAAASSKHVDEVPVPGETFTTEQAAEKAVSHLLAKYDLFFYGETLYCTPVDRKDYRVITGLPHDSNQTPGNLTAFYKANISWYDFTNLKSVIWPRDMEASITSELKKRVPQVRYMGIPCFLDDQWVETDSRDIRIVPLKVDPVTCSPAESLAWLENELQHDFCYATPTDKAKAMGMFLSPFIRSAFPDNVIPAAVWNAPESNVGKTIQANVCHTIATDKTIAPVLIHTSVEESELRKQITSALLSGAPTLLLDNVTKKLGGQAPESLMTSTVWYDRILGQSMTVSIPMSARVHITMNANTATDDFCRRIIGITTNKNPSLASGGSVRHQNLPLWTRKNAGEVRGHAVNIVKSWAAAGATMGTHQSQSSYQYFTSCLEGVLGSVGVQVGDFIDVQANKAKFADDDNSQATDLLVQWAFQRYGASDWNATLALETLIADQKDRYKQQAGDISTQINLDAILPDYDRLQSLDYINRRNRMWSRRIAKDVDRLVVTEDGKQLYIRKGARGKNGQLFYIQHANPSQVTSPLLPVDSSVDITF